MTIWRQDDSDEDEQLLRGAGGNWAGIRPSLDNPMTWSLKLFRVIGIDVRIHVIMIVYMILNVLRAVGAPTTGSVSLLSLALVNMGCLFMAVLLHEFGHCIACRWVGGSAREILMWPLGGLAFCRPPRYWRADFITTAGGPLVNVVLCVICSMILGLQTGIWWTVAIPNPFDASAGAFQVVGNWTLMIVYWFNIVNMLLFLFNVFVPCYPMDGGRMLQALLWPRYGYVQSMRYALRVGYFGAIAIGAIGLLREEYWLVILAIFCGMTCYQTHKQLEWTNAELGFNEDYENIADAKADSKRAAKRLRQEQEDASKLDGILKKIAESGMGSLSMRERRWLKRASTRKRKGA